MIPGISKDGTCELAMPTLLRLLVTLVVIVGSAYGAMLALASFVEPKRGEMSVSIPLEKLDLRRSGQ